MKEFTYDLDCSPGAIARLKAEAIFNGYVEAQINDERFPTRGTGITPVRYRIIPGEELKRSDGYVYRADVEQRFREMGMRFCDGAEALLPVAKDPELGRGAYTYIAFIQGTRDAFSVYEDGTGTTRDLKLNSVYDGWGPGCEFVGVCE